jgi:diguanylate cyclase (GGDEF)-like protein
MSVEQNPRSAEPIEPVLPEPVGWNDIISGTAGPSYWDRVVVDEQARIRRYGGSATVVLLELAGFEELRSRIGPDAALQRFARLSRALARQTRSGDHIARIAGNRFGLLLIGTDEVYTLNFVDRVLRTCQREIGESDAVEIGIGWASSGPRKNLSAALDTANQRLQEDFFGTR